MKKNLTFLFIVLFLGSVFAQDSSNIAAQNNKKITELQKMLGKQQEEIKTLKKQIDDGVETKEKAENVYSKANELIGFVEFVISLISILLAITGITAWFGIKKLINKRFTKILEEREQDLVKMFKEHEKENELLRNAKILIINQSNTKVDKNFRKVLNKFNNTPKIINTIDLVSDVETDSTIVKELSDFDAVILDNLGAEDEKKNWDFRDDENLKSKLIDLAKASCNNGSVFLYFGNQYKDGKFSEDNKLKEVYHLINFANKPATLFANLIDLLDYRRLLKQ